MQAEGIVWLGVRTDRLEATATFFADVMGLPVAERAHDFVRFQLPNHDQLELFGPSIEGQAHLTTGSIPEFLVPDVQQAHAELHDAGIEILRPVRFWRGDYGSLHFRGPDGNVYGVLSGRYYD